MYTMLLINNISFLPSCGKESIIPANILLFSHILNIANCLAHKLNVFTLFIFLIKKLSKSNTKNKRQDQIFKSQDGIILIRHGRHHIARPSTDIDPVLPWPGVPSPSYLRPHKSTINKNQPPMCHISCLKIALSYFGTRYETYIIGI